MKEKPTHVILQDLTGHYHFPTSVQQKPTEPHHCPSSLTELHLHQVVWRPRNMLALPHTDT